MKGKREARGPFEIVAIGVSAGGMQALPRVLSPLPDHFGCAIVVVQHLGRENDHGFFARYLEEKIPMRVTEAMERERVEAGRVYLAPAGYHLYIEKKKRFSLSIDGKVNFSRPAIDVLFETVADVYGRSAVGVVLTGASKDGAEGLRRIKQRGGMTLVQSPETAEMPIMPQAAIDTGCADHVLSLEEMPQLLLDL